MVGPDVPPPSRHRVFSLSRPSSVHPCSTRTAVTFVSGVGSMREHANGMDGIFPITPD